MAAMFRPLSVLMLVLSLTNAFLGSCQQGSPQNIETFYPYAPPPAPVPLPPPSPPPVTVTPPPSAPFASPPSPLQPPPPPPKSSSSDNNTVVKAVLGTVAGSIAISALVFFLIRRHTMKKPEGEPAGGPLAMERDNFRRFDGNVKGLIVDENGLDVLYWRNLRSGNARNGFRKEVMQGREERGRDASASITNGSQQRNSDPIQEVPLLREKPTSTFNQIQPLRDVELSASSVHLPFTSPPPPPPQPTPPMPGRTRSSSLEEEVRTTLAIPSVKSESTSPPPPPPAPKASNTRPSPPPPPPVPKASNARVLTPPPLPKAGSSAPAAPKMPPPPQPTPPMPGTTRSSSPEQEVRTTLAIPSIKSESTSLPPPPPAPKASNTRPSPPPPPPVPKASNARVPMPPPLPKAGSSAPAAPKMPPPLPKGKQREQSGRNQLETGQVKLKPLHWDKVNTNIDHSMVWNKIGHGSFQFDDDLMEALFGTVAANRKSPTGNGDQRTTGNLSPGSSVQIFLLDPRKSQNIAIVLKSLSVSRKEIIDGLSQGRGLDAETIEKLNRIAPTKEEESNILEFAGDSTRLADAESFLYHILKAMPSAFARFSAMQFRCNYQSEVLQLKGTLQTLELACKELRTRGIFTKLLEAILKAGNRMNQGTSRGNAQAFNLTALRKLSDVKSTDGKTTLLHFVVEEVVRAEGKRCVINRDHGLSRASSQSSNTSLTSELSKSKEDREKEYMMLGLPLVGGLSSEFSNVKKAATIDYESFSISGEALSARASEIQQLVLEGCGKGGLFIKEMAGFLRSAEEEISMSRRQQAAAMELVKRTTEYYQAGAARQKGGNPLQLFLIVKDFLVMVDQACVEITRKQQRKVKTRSTSGTGSSSPESPPKRPGLRFPVLSPDFFLPKSSGGSGESDTDL